MNTEDVKRKLSAILSADVEGYSRLMGDDERATVETITAYRKIMTDLIQGHNGRVVDAKGDNVLAEFPSVVDAIQCAVQVQQELKVKNADLPEYRRMAFRIGVNLGDVIEKGDTIYGDGVNIAARLESLADGGGICISGTAFDQIGKKVLLGYKYLGEQKVKNIEKSIRAYKVLVEPEAVGKVIGERARMKMWQWTAIFGLMVLIVVTGALAFWEFYMRPDEAPASVEKMAFPLPEKPSIAVLPFANLSGDPAKDYLSDGLADQIINVLSERPNIFVIARNSTFTYKGKSVKVQRVAEELGVQYVMEGSVQWSGDRIRITAQLVDALTGHQLFSERYDGELKDIFVLQDEITMKVITNMGFTSRTGEISSLSQKGTKNLDAFLKYLQAGNYMQNLNKQNLVAARRLAEEALTLDPDYAQPYSVLAGVNVFEVYLGASTSPKESLSRAEEMLKKALSSGESLAQAHIHLSLICIFNRQFEKALIEAQHAIALAPNSATANFMLGTAFLHSERFEDAVSYFKKALRMNPILPYSQCLNNLGSAYRFLGRYDEAIAAYEKLFEYYPDHLPGHANLAATYVMAGREVEARAEAAEVMRIDPNFSLNRFARSFPYRKELVAELVQAWRKAGLPENPPLPLPDKPSIAVLPFTNIGDPEQEYIADGITEQIITALARNPRLFVIASNSTFTYKGKPVMVQQVSRELGVRYVVEGSAQRSGDRIRITAQLIDAIKGEHMWAENYDRDLKDIFALQDEITLEILKATMGKLFGLDSDLSPQKGTTSVEAFLKYLKARTLVARNESNNRLARQMCEGSIALDPEFAAAYAVLGMSYWTDFFNGWSKSPGSDLKKASELAQKAIDMDEALSFPHFILGWIYLNQGKHDEAIDEAKKAVALDPSDVMNNATLGNFLAWADQPEEAISVLRHASRLNPFPTDLQLVYSGIAYMIAEQFEESLAHFKKAQERNPDNLWPYYYQASIYGRLGHAEQARVAAKELLRINPKFSVEFWAKWPGCKNRDKLNEIISGLRKAGLT